MHSTETPKVGYRFRELKFPVRNTLVLADIVVAICATAHVTNIYCKSGSKAALLADPQKQSEHVQDK